MAAGSWTVPQVVALINRYKVSGAQMVVDGQPFVSTFEGPGWADNWPVVREETGGILFIPDWSSLGPFGVGEKLDLIDGACKFLAPREKIKLLTPRPSLLGRVAQGWKHENDHDRGRLLQGKPPRQEVHDARQPLLLHQ